MSAGIIGYYRQACGKLTALLDFVSVGWGFSFIQRTRRSLSTSNIPYLWVSVQTHNTELTVSMRPSHVWHLRLRFTPCPPIRLHLKFLQYSYLKNSPSSLQWYESTRQLSSLFAWRSENLSFTLLRLKSSLKRVSLLRMEWELYQFGRNRPWFRSCNNSAW